MNSIQHSHFPKVRRTLTWITPRKRSVARGFLTAIVAMLTLTVYGQQPAKYDDINAIARVLAKEIPEINAKYDKKLSSAHTCPKEWSEEVKKNYLSYYGKPDEYDWKKKLQMYRYERPHLATDLVVVTYAEDYYGYGMWWYACNRKTGALTEQEIPLNYFDKIVFSNFSGWRNECDIHPDGNIEIVVAPSMQETNYAMIFWDKTKEKFTFKLKSYGGYYGCGDGGETEKDNAEMEQYVQEVIRPNFQRINGIKKWTLVEKKDVSGYGGYGEDWLENVEITCYFSEDGLEKAVFNVPQKVTYEYYFIDKNLSFVYHALYDDTGSTAKERRWYLKNGCFRGVGDKGKKLTPTQIKDEFYENEDEEKPPHIRIYRDIFRAIDDTNDD